MPDIVRKPVTASHLRSPSLGESARRTTSPRRNRCSRRQPKARRTRAVPSRSQAVQMLDAMGRDLAKNDRRSHRTILLPVFAATAGFAARPSTKTCAVSRDAARARECPPVPKCTRLVPAKALTFAAAGNTKNPFAGLLCKPSDGLEPSTPSLPWRCSTD